MARLFFYTTSVCSLCEKAKPQLWSALEGTDWQVEFVDLFKDDAAFDQFSTLIPALQAEGCKDYISWPFDSAAISAYLSQAQS